MMIRRLALVSFLSLAVPAFAAAPAPAVQQASAAPAPVQQEAAQSRFVVLDGGRNFRDVGGYLTADGHRVKPGVLYRSGSLGSLTPAGQETLRGLHIVSEIDLRTTEERSHDTFDIRGAIGPGYWTRDYGMSMGNMASLFRDPAKLTADSMRQMMAGVYKTLPREQAPAYRELFAKLEAGKGPLVVNCTAGKDRTGVGTALVLTALGVPYETVRKDFLLSNGAPGMDSLAGAISSPLAKLPPDVVAPLIGVDGTYLDGAFAQIRQDYGSIDNYLEKELGVGPRERAQLRRQMLEK